jgi:3-methyladenine DNA glycosylase AlkD
VSVSSAQALDALAALADPARGADMAAYHKVERPYLGVPVPQITELAQSWRAACTLAQRIDLAAALWDSNIHEARVAAAKLLTQARIRPDDTAWALIAHWAQGFDAWALADHASIAGGKRLVADPARLDQVEGWITHPNMWTRRAALVMTLPWTRLNHPKPADSAVRERVLGWAETYTDDPEWFIQKAIGWWLRDLSRHDPARVQTWIADHGARLKPFARREALRHLAPDDAPTPPDDAVFSDRGR